MGRMHLVTAAIFAYPERRNVHSLACFALGRSIEREFLLRFAKNAQFLYLFETRGEGEDVFNAYSLRTNCAELDTRRTGNDREKMRVYEAPVTKRSIAAGKSPVART